MRIIAILTVTTALTAFSSNAQEPVLLSEITLTAGSEATELSRSGSSVSVLDEDSLANRTGQPISQSISRLPGVTMTQSGPLGTTGNLQVRGAPAQYVPVIIDGIDVSDPAAGQPAFDIGGMTGANLGRVELLRGTQSSLYGSRAVGGVLSMQSLRPEQEGSHHRFAIEAGSFNTLLASYGVTLRQGGTDLAFSASRIHSDGFSAKDENDGNFERDGYDATRLNFYAAHELQNGAIIGLNGFWEKSEGDFDEFGGDITGTPGDEYNERESYGLRAFAQFSTGEVQHDVALTRYHIDRMSWTNGHGDPFVGTRTKLSWQGAMDLGGAGTRLIIGADTEKEKSEGNGDSRMTGAFAEIAVPISPRLDVNASLRRDEHSRFGGYTSGRLTAVYRANEDLLFRAAVGNGFRAPSLYELYDSYGNPDMEREESVTAELGVEKRWGDENYLRATAFYTEAENLIGFDRESVSCKSAVETGWPGCYAQVDGKARRKGVELDGRFAFGAGHALTASYTYTDSNVIANWADVPAHSLHLGVETEFTSGTTAGIALRYLAHRPGELEDFATVDLLFSHPLTENAQAYLRIENIFDKQYQLVDSYGTPDRSVYAGLRASF
ncbi:TonB-dependent receptor [Paracoccus onubensis]|uniref:TonB-dependent receptor plug domain-containing protein n=1 Tax=Paracoccus onubensis TaxID=1675788 RepID=UPI00272F1C4B|nr:TonB-dependent receptor [Paracoccus onubensis]MDP0925818.1 TonB-dependent receptor [Paracoccus onubensis]